MDVAIEFNSLSKAYNMAGWRVGMAVGNPEIINLLKIYKSQIDSSIFAPILDAAEIALTGDQSWLEERNAIYEERRDIVYNPKGALYLWAKLPKGFNNSMELCSKLLQETGVSITPGVVYGAHGEDYIRISIITPTEKLQTAMERVFLWMQKQERKKGLE